MTILLLGMMGSGKTTIGGALARLRGCEFYDLDKEIVGEARSLFPEKKARFKGDGDTKGDKNDGNKDGLQVVLEGVAGIFEEFGEAKFRQLEREVFKRLAAKVNSGRGGGGMGKASGKISCVISLGGGSFLQDEIAKEIKRKGLRTLWLDAPLELMWERVGNDPHRPLARNFELFRSIYLKRSPQYAEADFTIKGVFDWAPEEIAKKIINEVEGNV